MPPKWEKAPPIWDERVCPLRRLQCLDEDMEQQRALYKLSHCKDDDPRQYELRERRWIRVTYFGEVGLGGSDTAEVVVKTTA